jgi:oligopeptide/dipeptide ABC transporter ATP-binding protein
LPKVGKDVKQRLASIPGSVPDPFNLPKGCSFYPRCPAPKRETCLEPVPLYEVGPGHSARCTLYEPGERQVLKVLP